MAKVMYLITEDEDSGGKIEVGTLSLRTTFYHKLEKTLFFRKFSNYPVLAHEFQRCIPGTCINANFIKIRLSYPA